MILDHKEQEGTKPSQETQHPSDEKRSDHPGAKLKDHREVQKEPDQRRPLLKLGREGVEKLGERVVALLNDGE